MINRSDFSARTLTSNAGVLLLLEHASKNGIFDLIDHDLVFENASTNKIKVEEIMQKLSEFRHNHHPSGVKCWQNSFDMDFRS